MNCDGLTREYWRRQQERVEVLRERINSRAAATPGRVVPEDDALAIGEGKRLKLAIMFLDISGFSQRPSETSPEQDMLLRILNLFFSEMIRIAEEYGGTVEKNTGDGLMAYFADGGDPPESGAKRAVACALTMMAANEYLIRPILLATSAPGILYRVSIDYGPVTVARLGAPQRFNAYVAIGATANFASKMLSKAAPGEIVLGESAKNELPQVWQQNFTNLATTETGWLYRIDGRPYPLYRYTGRWKRLV